MPAPPAVEEVALRDALGRVLAEPLDASFPVPPWDNSAMDGYALRAADLPAEGGALPLAGRIAAGDAASQQLPAGHAVRIHWRAVAAGRGRRGGAETAVSKAIASGCRR